VMGVPAMFGFALGTDLQPRDLRSYHKSDINLYEHLAMKLIQRGVQPDADGREPWFLCYSLTEADVARTLQVFEESLAELKAEN
jgi:glutamate-1-semialdehyde aminotransferase